MITSIVLRSSVGACAAIDSTATFPDPAVQPASTLRIQDDGYGPPLGAAPIDTGSAIHPDPLKR